MTNKRKIALLLVDVRSAHNVGAILRTADGFGVTDVIAAGLTPYPIVPNDSRLPHVAETAQQKIAKTALGAEKSVKVEYSKDPKQTLTRYRQLKYEIYALEQSPKSVPLTDFKPAFPCLLVVGAETVGLPTDVLERSDAILEIPMYGSKESLNVAVATGIALFGLTSRH